MARKLTAEFYVYHLIDPRDQAVFYVGKGRGNRVHMHEREARRVGAGTNAKRVARIREIEAAGMVVQKEIVARFATEREALAFEQQEIARHPDLSNIAKRGSANTKQAQAENARAKGKPLVDFFERMARLAPEGPARELAEAAHRAVVDAVSRVGPEFEVARACRR